MAMSRKHFRSIAAILAGTDLTEEQRKELIQEFGRFCKSENSNFNWSTFEDACQPAK